MSAGQAVSGRRVPVFVKQFGTKPILRGLELGSVTSASCGSATPGAATRPSSRSTWEFGSGRMADQAGIHIGVTMSTTYRAATSRSQAKCSRIGCLQCLFSRLETSRNFPYVADLRLGLTYPAIV